MSKSKIKLFADAHCFDHEFQGTRSFLRGLYTELIENQKFDISFGCRNPGNLMAAIPKIDPEKIHTYKKGNTAWRLGYEIPRILNANRFDYAHFQYASPRRSGNTRYIVTLHDNLFDDFAGDFPFLYRQKRSAIFSRSIRKAHIRTTVSTYSQQRISSHYDIPEHSLHVVPNAASRSLGSLFKDKSEAAAFVESRYGVRDFLLCVSRIEPRKNQAALLNLYLKLELFKQNIPLVFVGHESISTPEFTRKLATLSEDQNKCIRWIPQVDEQDLEALYRACRLFIYPSRAEGFGIPPLEAAICGAPVLCSNVTAMKAFDFFEPFLFNPADELQFASKLRSLLESAPQITRLSGIAKAVHEAYSWEKSAGLFSAIIINEFNMTKTNPSLVPA